MEKSAHSKARWSKDQDNPHKSHVELSVDLSAKELQRFQSRVEFSQAYADNKEAMRGDLVKFFAEAVIPDVIKNATYQPEQTSAPLETEISADVDGNLDAEISNGIRSFHSQLTLTAELTSNQDVDPLTALNNSKGILATALADNVINNMNNIYLNQPREKTRHTIRMADDQVSDWQSQQAA